MVKKVQIRQDILEWIRAILIAVLLAFFIRSFLFEVTLVYGESMMSTLHHEDRIIINKLIYKLSPPERGDIVVFRNPDNTDEIYIKRVIGVGGDTIEIKDGKVYVNNMVIKETYLWEPTRGNYSKVEVPAETIFVMGDNRNHSQDSRSPKVGFVPLKNVLGKAELRIWPLSDIAWFRTDFTIVDENR